MFTIAVLCPMQMRHNDYDRAPLDHLSNEDIDAFYTHHSALTELIRAPNNVLKLLLRPGDCVIADNHRTLHGREAFQGRRRMVGCYISADEHLSRARVCGIESPVK
jgi:trimethyllysine dioxygenase